MRVSFRFWKFGSRASGLGFSISVLGSGIRVWGLVFDQAFGFIRNLGFCVQG